jgi:hypothetical protein
MEECSLEPLQQRLCHISDRNKNKHPGQTPMHKISGMHGKKQVLLAAKDIELFKIK